MTAIIYKLLIKRKVNKIERFVLKNIDNFYYRKLKKKFHKNDVIAQISINHNH